MCKEICLPETKKKKYVTHPYITKEVYFSCGVILPDYGVQVVMKNRCGERNLTCSRRNIVKKQQQLKTCICRSPSKGKLQRFGSSILPSHNSNEPTTAIANTFSYFMSTLTLDNDTLHRDSFVSISNVFRSQQVPLNLIINADPKQSSRPDNRNKSFHRFSVCTSLYCEIIFEKALSTSTVPLSWKHAKNPFLENQIFL